MVEDLERCHELADTASTKVDANDLLHASGCLVTTADYMARRFESESTLTGLQRGHLHVVQSCECGGLVGTRTPSNLMAIANRKPIDKAIIVIIIE